MIQIPVADWDVTNDLRCRWASNSGYAGNECDDVCNNLKSPRYVLVEECDGFIEALKEAKNKINNKNFGN